MNGHFRSHKDLLLYQHFFCVFTLIINFVYWPMKKSEIHFLGMNVRWLHLGSIYESAFYITSRSEVWSHKILIMKNQKRRIRKKSKNSDPLSMTHTYDLSIIFFNLSIFDQRIFRCIIRPIWQYTISWLIRRSSSKKRAWCCSIREFGKDERDGPSIELYLGCLLSKKWRWCKLGWSTCKSC